MIATMTMKTTTTSTRSSKVEGGRRGSTRPIVAAIPSSGGRRGTGSPPEPYHLPARIRNRMGRQPLDDIPQYRLVAELRRAIDIARLVDVKTVTYERAVAKILQLCRDNPHATLRIHVLHNLGCKRRLWLRQLAPTIAPHALVREAEGITMRRHLDRMGCLEDDTEAVS